MYSTLLCEVTLKGLFSACDSTLFWLLWSEFPLYGGVNGVGVGGISLCLLRKMSQLQLKHKTLWCELHPIVMTVKYKKQISGRCTGTCFIIAAVVITPQISVRETFLSSVLFSSQAIISLSGTAGPCILEINLSIWISKCGSLYRDDMALWKKKERHGVGQNSAASRWIYRWTDSKN